MFENFLNALLGELDPQHAAMRSVRDIIDRTLTGVFTAAGAEDGARIVSVCQWPERECETVYVLGSTGNVVRVRVDGVSAAKAEEFMREEPNVNMVRIPEDASDLLKGDLGL